MPVFAASLVLLALAVSLDGFGVGVAYGLRRIRIPALSVAIIACCSALAVALAMSAGNLLAGWLTPQAASAAGAVILIALGGWALRQSLHSRDSDGRGEPDRQNGRNGENGRQGRRHGPDVRRSGQTLDGQDNRTDGGDRNGQKVRIGSADRNVEDERLSPAPPGNVERTGASRGGMERADTSRNGAYDPLAGTLPGADGTGAVSRPVPRVSLLTLEIRPLGIIIHILRTPSAADADRSGTISAGEAVWLGAALSLDAFGAGIGAALLGLPVVGTPLAVALSCAAFLWLGLGVGRKAGGRPLTRAMSVLPGAIMIALGVLRLF